MKTFWGLVVLLVGAKGDLPELATMIQEETGKPALDYISYGCYCGLGGTGQPLDATDHCCETHDCCYGKLSACFPKLNYYEYTRQEGVITCALGKGRLSGLDLNTYNATYNSPWELKCGKELLKC